MQLALYARASAREDNPEDQLEALREFARRAAHAVVLETVDRGVRSPSSKTGLTRLLRAVRAREIEAVACTGLDRLARSVRDLLSLGEILAENGVALIALESELHTTREPGFFDALRHVRALESASFRERTISGIHRARAAGVPMGRPRALDARMRTRAQKMLDEGYSQREIARALRVGRSTLQREFGTVPR